MHNIFVTLASTLTCHTTGESGGGVTRDAYISQVSQDIQSKLPKLFDLEVIQKRFEADISPTSVVLLQELERFNKLVIRMQQSLVELQRVRMFDRKTHACVFRRVLTVLYASGLGR